MNFRIQEQILPEEEQQALMNPHSQPGVSVVVTSLQFELGGIFFCFLNVSSRIGAFNKFNMTSKKKRLIIESIF